MFCARQHTSLLACLCYTLCCVLCLCSMWSSHMLPVLLSEGADNESCVATFLNSADNATSQDEQLICVHLFCTGLLVANVCLACLKSLATPTNFVPYAKHRAWLSNCTHVPRFCMDPVVRARPSRVPPHCMCVLTSTGRCCLSFNERLS